MPTPFKEKTEHRYSFWINAPLREAVLVAMQYSGHGTVAALVRDLLKDYVHQYDISLRDIKQFGKSKVQEARQEATILTEQNRSLRSELSRTRHELEKLQANLNNMISQGRIV
ncbi:hypothetical protein IQ230_09735 [Gloeocapsopsis crepidinum LEGE 06123]|uniref:Uncharacterized protein n=1 Tax=Gloeocapsopsis crepidinum LEGE 06123 TaxID=588587 RepID=A0ABR9UQT4_9CHRO|nr:hypothetical protein [Gloeocapsopsis crepidinum]MBE9190637.1 hypothetical protein [Gloeocapsopsis crepidinum LEGE 06123]